MDPGEFGLNIFDQNATLFQYLAYTICFRQEEGFCKIAYATNKYSTSDAFISDGKSGKDIAKVISKGFISYYITIS